MSEKQQIRLAPLGGLQSERVSDHTLGDMSMRGSFNVERVDGEWWTRKGEDLVAYRLGSAQWTYIGMGNVKFILANPFWALQLNSTSPEQGVTNLYSPSATETVTLTKNSQFGVTSAHTGVPGELLLVGPGYTTQVYRITAGSGTDITLERPFEGDSDVYTCRFIPQLAQDPSGTNQSYYDGICNGPASYVVFEQLVGHTAGDAAAHTNCPAVTAGRRYLIITSTLGCPVAIDLGTITTVKRNWFFRTGLASGTETNIASANGYGQWATTYKNRLIIANAPDNNNRLASRTIWHSRQGDFCLWHTGIKGKTASPNSITFDGPNDDIAGVDVLRDQVILHRQRSQEIGSFTGSDAAPLNFRSNNQGLGIYSANRNLWIHTRSAHFLWTQRGPGVFDGSQISLIAQEAYRDLVSYRAAEAPNVLCAIHDEQRARIYWVLGEDNTDANNRHQAATMPVSGERLLADGYQYAAAKTVFVYSYEDGTAWFEDRTSIYGGGHLGEPAIESAQGTYASRFDGTIVKLRGETTGIDPGISGASEDHVVQAQVETGWIDFGNTVTQKHLTGVELVLRALHVSEETLRNQEEISDVWSSEDDRLYIRLQVFSDYNLTTPIADVGKAFRVSDMLALKLTDNRQYPAFNIHFSTDGQGRSLKFRVSNTLNSEASAAGYRMAPFRLSEIVAHVLPKESTRPTAEMQA